MDRLRGILLVLLGHPLYAVRQLVSRSLAALTEQHQLDDTLESLVQSLPSSHTACHCFNRLHGSLLLIQILQDTHMDRSVCNYIQLKFCDMLLFKHFSLFSILVLSFADVTETWRFVNSFSVTLLAIL